jgi:hypothetical protein
MRTGAVTLLLHMLVIDYGVKLPGFDEEDD